LIEPKPIPFFSYCLLWEAPHTYVYAIIVEEIENITTPSADRTVIQVETM